MNEGRQWNHFKNSFLLPTTNTKPFYHQFSTPLFYFLFSLSDFWDIVPYIVSCRTNQGWREVFLRIFSWHTDIHIETHTHENTHRHILTHKHNYTYTYIHTHTHTHIQYNKQTNENLNKQTKTSRLVTSFFCQIVTYMLTISMNVPLEVFQYRFFLEFIKRHFKSGH